VLTVLREALSNAARHSGATRVDVMVNTDARGDADGARPGQRPRNSRNEPAQRLANTANRAEKLGGQLRVSRADGAGTELEWKVPVGAD
jgi:two-component system, NarL family, sensor histidine kinase DevS